MADKNDQKKPEIRETLEADIDALIKLENLCFDTYYRDHRFTHAEFEYYVRNGDTICLAAIADSSPVGYVAGTIKRLRDRMLVSVDSIAVIADFRKRGLGSRLLNALIRNARRRGCERISLVVAARNEAGIGFFAERGFKRLRTIPSYYGEGIDGFLMVSDIS
ncbi:MAG TPA: N-acetyltransferase [Sedimentisphaerales bacterium]|nr:N-acetyltransferase [Sedimentisphaerales bacterium]